MPDIRPISDLRNKFTELSESIHASNEPVFLTKNGCGDMVVMSIEAYEQLLAENDIYIKLREAEIQADSTKERISHDELFEGLAKKLNEGMLDV